MGHRTDKTDAEKILGDAISKGMYLHLFQVEVDAISFSLLALMDQKCFIFPLTTLLGKETAAAV
jgi:hypothetical protein